jgi:hypothetical protein
MSARGITLLWALRQPEDTIFSDHDGSLWDFNIKTIMLNLPQANFGYTID